MLLNQGADQFQARLVRMARRLPQEAHITPHPGVERAVELRLQRQRLALQREGRPLQPGLQEVADRRAKQLLLRGKVQVQRLPRELAGARHLFHRGLAEAVAEEGGERGVQEAAPARILGPGATFPALGRRFTAGNASQGAFGHLAST